MEAAKLLVEHGASIYIENKEEKTPLQLAKGGLGALLRRIVEGWLICIAFFQKKKNVLMKIQSKGEATCFA